MGIFIFLTSFTLYCVSLTIAVVETVDVLFCCINPERDVFEHFASESRLISVVSSAKDGELLTVSRESVFLEFKYTLCSISRCVF